MLNANKVKSPSTKKRAPALPPGTYPVRVVQVISLGTQKQQQYKDDDKPKPPVPTLYVTYEFLDEFMKDDEGEELKDKPRWLSETLPLYSLKSDRAKSTQRYYALDPLEDKKGDWAQLLGAPAMLTLINKPSKKEKDVVFENVDSLSTMRPKEVERAPALVNPTKVFDFDAPDVDVFLSLPDWLQDKIKEAVDFAGSPLEALLNKSGGQVAKKTSEPVEAPVEPVAGDDEEEW